MTEFPADVEDRYRRLAERRTWPPETENAFRATVAWYRRLDESPHLRRYFEYVDSEGLVDLGARSLWEAVEIDNETVATKQIEVSSTGAARRYWWRSLEDDAGMLTDQPLEPDDPDQPGLVSIPSSAFFALWNSIGD